MPDVPIGSDVVAAIDVGGTRIKAALVDASFDVLTRATVPTPKDIAADIGAVVQATVADLLVSVELQTSTSAWSVVGSSYPVWWTRRAVSDC